MATTLYASKATSLRSGGFGKSNMGGVARTEVDSYTVPVATIAAGDTVIFGVRIPKGAKMLGGVFKNTAGGAAATGKVGTYTRSGNTFTVVDDDHYGTLTDMTGATSQTFGDTDAKKYLEEATADWYIGVLTAAQAVQAAAVVTVEIRYLV